MSHNLLKWLNKAVILSAIGLVLNAALLIVRIAFTISGFGDWNLPSCAVSSYLQLKINQTPLIFKANSILNGLALTLSVIIIVLLIQKRRSVTINQQQGHQVQIPDLMRTTVETYPPLSFQILFLVVNGGSAISILTYNNSCQTIDPNISIAILIISNCALIISLALLTVIIYLNRLQPSQNNNPNQIITDRQRQEQEIQKKLQEQAKEYLTNNHHDKNQLMKGLLPNEEEISSEYSGGEVKKQSQRTIKETTTEKNKRKAKNQQEKQINIEDMGGEPIYKEAQKQNNSSQDTQKIKNNKQQLRAGVVHGYHRNHRLQENKQGQEFHNQHSQQHPNNNMEQSQRERQFRFQEIRRLKNTLTVTEIDNISDKFEEDNFELQEDLPIPEKANQEQLSHLQIKQLNRFTDQFFNLKATSKDFVTLEKQYFVSGDQKQAEQYNINIHFAKIMQHKANLQLNQSESQDGMNPNNQQLDNINIDSLLYSGRTPINEQIIKLSKIILFKNYPRLRKNDESSKQYECPISKYIDGDEQLEIMQNMNSKHKGKKGQYNLEKVVFEKKRKYLNQEQRKQQVKHNYHDKVEVIKQRREIFGPEWLRQRQIQQKFTPETPQIKSKRFSNLSFIRSKCQ